MIKKILIPINQWQRCNPILIDSLIPTIHPYKNPSALHHHPPHIHTTSESIHIWYTTPAKTCKKEKRRPLFPFPTLCLLTLSLSLQIAYFLRTFTFPSHTHTHTQNAGDGEVPHGNRRRERLQQQVDHRPSHRPLPRSPPHHRHNHR